MAGIPDTARNRRWQATAGSALAVAAVTAYAWGWKAFWFLTDDAYIAFRYVSNRQLGFGYVWNAPPFQPVEGYTSFLWVALLDAAWTSTGAPPPVSANWLAFAFGLGTLGLSAWMLQRMNLCEALARWRPWLLFAVLLGLVSNPTFLTWSSSGLETALVNVLFLAWTATALYTAPGSPRFTTGVALTSSLLALTRPDGLLVVAVSAALVAAVRLTARPRPSAASLLAAWPFALPVAHVLWRRSFYGEWLPNTYYAKVVAPWPEAGLRYLLSYGLEYGLWLWGLLAAAWALRVLRSPGAPALRMPAPQKLPALAVCATVLAHLAYYTLVVGGDHFAYRVYSHTVPMVLLSSVWLANRLAASGPRARRAAVFLPFAVVAVAWPIPWSHHVKAGSASTRVETANLVIPLADDFPPGTRWYVRRFDALQRWLIEEHAIGKRRREHEVFHALQSALWPRHQLTGDAWQERRGVISAASVGVVGWILARADVIDTVGLNDYVVARNPVLRGDVGRAASRRMAHARQPPDGYLACFPTNVRVDRSALRRRGPGGREMLPRRLPLVELRALPEPTVSIDRDVPALSAADVVRCEAEWRERIAREIR
ncbi:MAG: hypothetical protein ACE5FL_03760 [Myxococcota bacterium]